MATSKRRVSIVVPASSPRKRSTTPSSASSKRATPRHGRRVASPAHSATSKASAASVDASEDDPRSVGVMVLGDNVELDDMLGWDIKLAREAHRKAMELAGSQVRIRRMERMMSALLQSPQAVQPSQGESSPRRQGGSPRPRTRPRRASKLGSTGRRASSRRFSRVSTDSTSPRRRASVCSFAPPNRRRRRSTLSPRRKTKVAVPTERAVVHHTPVASTPRPVPAAIPEAAASQHQEDCDDVVAQVEYLSATPRAVVNTSKAAPAKLQRGAAIPMSVLVGAQGEASEVSDDAGGEPPVAVDTADSAPSAKQDASTAGGHVDGETSAGVGASLSVDTSAGGGGTSPVAKSPPPPSRVLVSTSSNEAVLDALRALRKERVLMDRKTFLEALTFLDVPRKNGGYVTVPLRYFNVFKDNPDDETVPEAEVMMVRPRLLCTPYAMVTRHEPHGMCCAARHVIFHSPDVPTFRSHI